MLHITQHTSRRLVLEDKRTRLRVFSLLFLALSLLTLSSLLVNSAATAFNEGGLDPQRLPAQITFLVADVALVGVALFFLLNLSRKVRITFDRESETVVVRQQSFSLYSVSHIRVEGNDEIGVYALYLVLRMGQQVPLATLPYHEQVHMERLVAEVKAFLKR